MAVGAGAGVKRPQSGHRSSGGSAFASAPLCSAGLQVLVQAPALPPGQLETTLTSPPACLVWDWGKGVGLWRVACRCPVWGEGLGREGGSGAYEEGSSQGQRGH